MYFNDFPHMVGFVVENMFCNVWLRCPLIVDVVIGRCHRAALATQ